MRGPHEQAPRRRGLTLARVFGLVGTSALLAIGAAIVMLVTGRSGEGEQLASATAVAATPTPTPEAERGKKAAKPRMSRRARAARRAAVADVNAQGWSPVSLKTYQPDRELRVLIAAPTGDKEGGRRAFFFVNRRLIGADTADPSARISLDKTRGERWLTLTYRLYEEGDRACCPRGERQKVRFEWDGAALTPVDPLPPPELRIKRR